MNQINDCCPAPANPITVPLSAINLCGASLTVDGSVLSQQPGTGGCEGCISFSLEEQWTGKYWINGEKIYQKTIDCGTMPNNTVKYIPTGITGIDFIIDFAGVTSNSEEAFTLPRGTWVPTAAI